MPVVWGGEGMIRTPDTTTVCVEIEIPVKVYVSQCEGDDVTPPARSITFTYDKEELLRLAEKDIQEQLDQMDYD